MKMPPHQFGLLPTPPDERDFPLGAIYDLPDPKTLPEEFVLEDFPAQDQGPTSFCSGYGTAGMSSLQEGKVMSGPFAYAVGQMLNPMAWGQNSREAMKAHVTYGCIPLEIAPDMVPQVKDEEFLRDIKNWAINSLELAKEGKKQSFFAVTGPYDAFDNIRGAIYYFREKKRASSAGVMWKWRISDYVLKGSDMSGSGHFMYYKGWKMDNGEPKLVVRNSFGQNAGKDGDHLLGRDEVNAYVRVFQSYMFVDISKEDAKYYLKYGMSPDTNSIFTTAHVAWVEFVAIISRLIELYKALLELKKQETMAQKTLVEAIIEVESGGDDMAIGDKWMANQAYGAMQIRQPACDDVNRVFGKKYVSRECLGNRAQSLDIFEKYMAIYATAKRLGREVTDEDKARILNGGPNGYKKIATLVYWSKVKRAMGA